MVGHSKSALNDDSATESFDTTIKAEGEVEGDNGPPSDPGSSLYSEGEKVLAYHQGTIYSAKGWNKSWDEWVGVDRLLKHTEENIQKKKANNEKQESEKKQKIGRMMHTKPKTSNVPRGKKRKSDSIIKEKRELPLEKLVNIQIPSTLRKQLIDDSEFITHLGKVVKLPRSPNVQDILRKYVDYRLKKDGSAESIKEIMNGVGSYFDKALPIMLLYKSERQQYEQVVKAELPSYVYGAEHLLCLFVKLPELLFHVTIEEETQTELQQNLVDFLRFLQKNQSSFFLSSYHTPEEIETSTNEKVD